MKTCVTCKIEKSLDDFNKLARSKDGKQPSCRECHKARYRSNREHHIARVGERNKRVRTELRNRIWELKKGPCADCGARFHPVAMDFDHLEDNKVTHVSRMLSDVCSWETILEEVAKCDLVCANCHRVRTFTRLGTITI